MRGLREDTAPGARTHEERFPRRSRSPQLGRRSRARRPLPTKRFGRCHAPRQKVGLGLRRDVAPRPSIPPGAEEDSQSKARHDTLWQLVKTILATPAFAPRSPRQVFKAAHLSLASQRTASSRDKPRVVRRRFGISGPAMLIESAREAMCAKDGAVQGHIVGDRELRRHNYSLTPSRTVEPTLAISSPST